MMAIAGTHGKEGDSFDSVTPVRPLSWSGHFIIARGTKLSTQAAIKHLRSHFKSEKTVRHKRRESIRGGWRKEAEWGA